jgi:hypothetical protein
MSDDPAFGTPTSRPSASSSSASARKSSGGSGRPSKERGKGSSHGWGKHAKPVRAPSPPVSLWATVEDGADADTSSAQSRVTAGVRRSPPSAWAVAGVGSSDVLPASASTLSPGAPAFAPGAGGGAWSRGGGLGGGDDTASAAPHRTSAAKSARAAPSTPGGGPVPFHEVGTLTFEAVPEAAVVGEKGRGGDSGAAGCRCACVSGLSSLDI